MNKLTAYLLFAVILSAAFSFTIPNHSQKFNSGDGEYVYFRVVDVSTEPAISYFTNVIWVEGSGSDHSKAMYKQKERFAAYLKSEYDLPNFISIVTAYNYQEKERAEDDRKNRIKQASRVKHILL